MGTSIQRNSKLLKLREILDPVFRQIKAQHLPRLYEKFGLSAAGETEDWNSQFVRNALENSHKGIGLIVAINKKFLDEAEKFNIWRRDRTDNAAARYLVQAAEYPTDKDYPEESEEFACQLDREHLRDNFFRIAACYVWENDLKDYLRELTENGYSGGVEFSSQDENNATAVLALAKAQTLETLSAIVDQIRNAVDYAGDLENGQLLCVDKSTLYSFDHRFSKNEELRPYCPPAIPNRSQNDLVDDISMEGIEFTIN